MIQISVINPSSKCLLHSFTVLNCACVLEDAPTIMWSIGIHSPEVEPEILIGGKNFLKVNSRSQLREAQ